MGPKLGEATDGVPWGYRVWFPVVTLFRMARIIISPLLFFLNYIIGSKNENELVVQFEFNILKTIIKFSWELLLWFKFLLWLGSYYLLFLTETTICIPYSCFLAFYGNEFNDCSALRRRSDRKWRQSGRVPITAINEIFLVLSVCIRIYADQAHYFVRTILDNFLLFPTWRYATYKIFLRVWVAWGDLEPP